NTLWSGDNESVDDCKESSPLLASANISTSVLTGCAMCVSKMSHLSLPAKPSNPKNLQVFFDKDISWRGATGNFHSLCKEERSSGSATGKPPNFKGYSFH
ncbi:hypothetical protein U0070_001809, partial [Myodes glareolus]